MRFHLRQFLPEISFTFGRAGRESNLDNPACSVCEPCFAEKEGYWQLQNPRQARVASGHLFSESAVEGVKARKLKDSLPIIICLDFVNDIVRQTNTDCVQPVRVSFEKPPFEVASEHWSVYYVQIPRFLAREAYFDDPLDCFLYAACESHEKHLTIREVINMTQELQTHEAEYPGFGQLADRHANAASDPAVREQHYQWLMAELKYWGEYYTAVNRAVKEVTAEKDAVIAEKDAEIAALRAQLGQK
jgi:hypothetical protein